MSGLGSLALSYAAGALTSLSPCVLPLLPVLLVSALQNHALGPLALAAGLSASFAGTGLFIASAGLSLGIDADQLRLGVAALMILFGVILLIPALQMKTTQWMSPLTATGNRWLEHITPIGLGGQFILGLLLGVAWSPCAGPTLGAAIGLATQSETMMRAGLILVLFGLGAATPIIALAYGSRQALATRRNGLKRIAGIAKPAMGATLTVVGLFVLSGADRAIETVLTNAMPDWLLNITTRF